MDNTKWYENDYRFIEIIGLFIFANVSTVILYLIICPFLKGKCLSYGEVYLLIQNLSFLFFSISYSKLFSSFSAAFSNFFSFVPSVYEFKKALLYFFISIILVVLILTFSYFILQFLGIEDISTDIDDSPFLLSPYRFFIYFIMSCFFGPLAEELFFRKIFYSYLRKKMSFLPALIISALIFGLLHSSSSGRIIFATAMGVILSYAYEKHNSLFINSCIHAYMNIFGLLIRLIFYYFGFIA
ncbi:MAG: CPBP family intramembrane metalloprotease [Elusimicrobiota bacterium]